MSADNPYNITEKDLKVFPPKMGYFLGATLCLMLAHGASIFIASYYYAALKPQWLVLTVTGTVVFFAAFNIGVLQGRARAVQGLKALAYIYTAISLSAVLDIFSRDINTAYAGFALFVSLGAIAFLVSPGYKNFCQTIIRRWTIYRETGRTLIEEYQRVQLKK